MTRKSFEDYPRWRFVSVVGAPVTSFLMRIDLVSTWSLASVAVVNVAGPAG
jgi:hypothetical protein